MLLDGETEIGGNSIFRLIGRVYSLPIYMEETAQDEELEL